MKGLVLPPPLVIIIGKSLTALNWRKQLMRHATAFNMKGEVPCWGRNQMARERRERGDRNQSSPCPELHRRLAW